LFGIRAMSPTRIPVADPKSPSLFDRLDNRLVSDFWMSGPATPLHDEAPASYDLSEEV
jgi:hypothetical protein